MSTKSAVSTICLVACANRASSRSIAGILKKPGRKIANPNSSRNTTARKWLAVAKSNAMASLRLECVGFTGCWPAPKRGTCVVSTIHFAYDETAVQTTRCSLHNSVLPDPVGHVPLLHPDHHRIRGPGGVDHRKPGKPRSGRIDQPLAPAVDFADRNTVDTHGQ